VKVEGLMRVGCLLKVEGSAVSGMFAERGRVIDKKCSSDSTITIENILPDKYFCNC
jgi:hypothetical protein